VNDLVVEAARSSRRPRNAITVDLIIGDNRINHGLGVIPRGCGITPTVADASFAWAITARDDRQAIITVVGIAQPGATAEFY
jgi:hypothetical protein